MPPKTSLPTSFLYAVEQNRRKAKPPGTAPLPASGKTRAIPLASGSIDDLKAGDGTTQPTPIPLGQGSGPNLFAGGALRKFETPGTPLAKTDSFLSTVEKMRAAQRQPEAGQFGPTMTGVKPPARQAPAGAATASTPAPRADRGLALLDQMQNDRAAGLAPGASSSLSGPGSTRKLESDAGKAERLARRYMRKFGRFGASAASGLLEGAAAERMGTPGVRSEAYRKADQAIEAEAQGVAAQTTAIEKAELQDRLRRIQQGRTGKAGRGTAIKKPQP